MAQSVSAGFIEDTVALKRRGSSPLRSLGPVAGRAARIAAFLLVVPLCLALLLTVWLAVQLVRQ